MNIRKFSWQKKEKMRMFKRQLRRVGSISYLLVTILLIVGTLMVICARFKTMAIGAFVATSTIHIRFTRRKTNFVINMAIRL